MDSLDYTRLLEAAGIISNEQSEIVCTAIMEQERLEFIQKQAIEREFFENEGRYGSS